MGDSQAARTVSQDARSLSAIGLADLARHATGTINMLTNHNAFTSDRARSEIGWSPSIVRDIGLTEAFRLWKSACSSSPALED